MKRISIALIALSLVFTSSILQAWSPDKSDKMELSVAQTLLTAKEKDPNLEKWFNEAYAYAVFPKVGKGGIGIGGAHGKGKVYRQGTPIGKTSMTQLTIGLQLGGQAYSQIIFFENEAALEQFTSGNFEFGAQATAVAITAGASAEANTGGGASAGASGGKNDATTTSGGYRKGMAIFTVAKGGLMYDCLLYTSDAADDVSTV